MRLLQEFDTIQWLCGLRVPLCIWKDRTGETCCCCCCCCCPLLAHDAMSRRQRISEKERGARARAASQVLGLAAAWLRCLVPRLRGWPEAAAAAGCRPALSNLKITNRIPTPPPGNLEPIWKTAPLHLAMGAQGRGGLPKAVLNGLGVGVGVRIRSVIKMPGLPGIPMRQQNKHKTPVAFHWVVAPRGMRPQRQEPEEN